MRDCAPVEQYDKVGLLREVVATPQGPLFDGLAIETDEVGTPIHISLGGLQYEVQSGSQLDGTTSDWLSDDGEKLEDWFTKTPIFQFLNQKLKWIFHDQYIHSFASMATMDGVINVEKITSRKEPQSEVYGLTSTIFAYVFETFGTEGLKAFKNKLVEHFNGDFLEHSTLLQNRTPFNVAHSVMHRQALEAGVTAGRPATPAVPELAREPVAMETIETGGPLERIEYGEFLEDCEAVALVESKKYLLELAKRGIPIRKLVLEIPQLNVTIESHQIGRYGSPFPDWRNSMMSLATVMTLLHKGLYQLEVHRQSFRSQRIGKSVSLYEIADLAQTDSVRDLFKSSASVILDLLGFAERAQMVIFPTYRRASDNVWRSDTGMNDRLAIHETTHCIEGGLNVASGGVREGYARFVELGGDSEKIKSSLRKVYGRKVSFVVLCQTLGIEERKMLKIFRHVCSNVNKRKVGTKISEGDLVSEYLAWVNS